MIENYLMVRMPEEVDHHKSVYISETTDRYILKEGIGNIVFDFENTKFMDSSGIGAVMGRYRLVHLIGGEVWGVHANARIKKILTMSGVTKIMQIYEEDQR